MLCDVYVSKILFFFIALETYAAGVKIASAGCEVMYQMKTPCPALGGQRERAASRHNDTPPFQAQVAQVWSSLGRSHYILEPVLGALVGWGWGTVLRVGLVWVGPGCSGGPGWPGVGAGGQ